jgi:hypothetical protein
MVIVSRDKALFDIADLVEPRLRWRKALAICTNHFLFGQINYKSKSKTLSIEVFWLLE